VRSNREASTVNSINFKNFFLLLSFQAELSTRLANERPRNHLDARHRLDAEGKRYGKVIDFAISELRVIELIEDLCVEMEKYQLNRSKEASNDSDEENQRWILSSKGLFDSIAADGDDGSSDKTAEEDSQQLIKEQRRILKNTCSDIIGDWEDDIADAITKGKANSKSVRDVLCVDIGNYCPKEQGAAGHRPLDEL
jgi:protein canopy 1/2